jgi:hypothetical protein
MRGEIEMTKLPQPTVRDVESKITPRTPAPTFSESRWPYTYACDLVRSHPEVVPQAVHDAVLGQPSVITYPGLNTNKTRVRVESRTDATRLRRSWSALIAESVADIERADERLARVLALTYCNVEGIEVPGTFVNEVFRVGGIAGSRYLETLCGEYPHCDPVNCPHHGSARPREVSDAQAQD